MEAYRRSEGKDARSSSAWGRVRRPKDGRDSGVVIDIGSQSGYVEASAETEYYDFLLNHEMLVVRKVSKFDGDEGHTVGWYGQLAFWLRRTAGHYFRGRVHIGACPFVCRYALIQ
jgi:hypothetical protein